jgi:hypothetical protein
MSPTSEPENTSDSIYLLRLGFKALLVLACLALVVGLFYLEENWRGKRAWENYKKEIEAKGERLDLAAFLPERVADEDNILKAPVMVSKQQPIRAREAGMLVPDWQHGTPSDLPEWNQFFSGSNTPLVIATGFPSSPQTNLLSGGEIMPLITIEDAPLADAIHTLARQGEISYTISRQVLSSNLMDTSVTIRFENVTARHALAAVLDNYGLAIVQNGTNKPLQIIAKKLDIVADLDSGSNTNDTKEPRYSRVQLTNASLTNAISYFGEAMGTSFQFDPTAWKRFETNSRSHGVYSSPVSGTWREQTASATLQDILATHSLQIRTNSGGMLEIQYHPRSAAEILEAFEEFDSEFKEIHKACARPKSRMDFDYTDLTKSELPSFARFRSFAQVLSLKASAELAVNKPEAALGDIQTCLRLADAIANEPTLVSGMMRVALMGLSVGPMWEGLAAGRWNEKQLLELQHALNQIDLLSSTRRSIQACRAYDTFCYINRSPQQLRKSFDNSWWDGHEEPSRFQKRRAILYVPRGWIYQNVSLLNRLFQENEIEVIDLKQSIVSPEKLQAAHKRMDREYETIKAGNFIASIAYNGFEKAWRNVAQNQTAINEALIGCALERYRLAQGKFPDRLDVLAPDFLAKIPHDVINGEPLKYRLTDDGQYLLYSVAWNGKDDNGTPPSDYRNDEGVDWTWRFPKRHP